MVHAVVRFHRRVQSFINHLNFIGMKYIISYTHTLGECSLMCNQNEVAGVLQNITLLALSGHHFANLTITKP